MNTNLQTELLSSHVSECLTLQKPIQKISFKTTFVFLTLLCHQFFFDCLRERISCGGKKKRLPNFTTGFVRRDAVPLGTFTKYTWHITNIIHVKQIFETPLVSTFIYFYLLIVCLKTLPVSQTR